MFDQQKSVLAAVVLLAGGLAWSQPASAAHDERHYGSAWFELGGYYNSEDASRGEGILFAPLMHGENGMLFTDIRMKFFEDDVREGNFALGYRHMTGHGFNYGVWIGADIRESALDNSFNQLSGGFEALSHNLDFRLNWYGPGTDAKAGGAVGFTTVEIEGSNIFMIGGQEVLLQGVDAEIGIRLPVEKLNIDPNKFELRAYGGGFHFDDDDALEEVAGGKARITLAMNDIIPQLPGSRLTAEYEYSYDDVREDRHEVGGRLRIPLSDPGTSRALSSMSHQERRMMDGLERDTDVITARSKRENVEDFFTETDFDRVAFVNTGGSVTTASANAGDNSLLIVNGTVTDGAQQVQGNQTVQGGGSTILVTGLTSGTVAGFTAPGSKPTVTSAAGDIIALQGNNTHIVGLIIDGQGTSGDGIDAGDDKTNILIAQNMIQNTGNDGINFGDRNTDIGILDNTIADTSNNESIDFGSDNSLVVIDGNDLTDPDSDGILFNNRNTFIFITNNEISGGSDQGVEFDDDNSNLVISGNTISDFNDEGINIDDNNSNILISNNTIFDVGDEGIEFDNGNSNVTITGNTITATDDAILFDGANNAADRNTNIVIAGNTLVAGVNDEGIQFDDGNQNITIANNTITAGDDGIQFDNNNTGLSITGNTIVSNTEDGFEIDNNNSGTISGNTITAATGDGVNLNNDNVFTISGNTFNAIGDDAIRFNDNNTITIADNIFNGAIGGQLLDVDGLGNTLSGAGNVSNVGVTCESGVFAGTVEVSGVILQDGVAPCN